MVEVAFAFWSVVDPCGSRVAQDAVMHNTAFRQRRKVWNVVRCVIFAYRNAHEATGVHYAARRNGYGVAAWGARTKTTKIPLCWSAGVRVASASVRRRILARSARPRLLGW